MGGQFPERVLVGVGKDRPAPSPASPKHAGPGQGDAGWGRAGGGAGLCAWGAPPPPAFQNRASLQMSPSWELRRRSWKVDGLRE